MRNLVENAVQHSPPGATVALEVAAAGEIAVSDAGPGVPADQREAIFEPFWSGDTQARRSGLGLAIVRRIAERSGAAVSVERAAGGATFRLRFPETYDSAESDTGDSGGIDRSIPASLAVRRRVAALGRAAS
ncbi:MAG: sensor histidine kinase [Thiohalocapsa sp.]